MRPVKPDRWNYVLVLLISTCLFVTSCTSTRPTSFPNEQTPNTQPNVAIGDTVRVTLNTGEVRQFKVTSLHVDALVGKDIRIPYKDVRFLEVKKFDGWRSVGLALGVVVTLAAALFLYLVSRIESD
jgi:hypothetical protein